MMSLVLPCAMNIENQSFINFICIHLDNILAWNKHLDMLQENLICTRNTHRLKYISTTNFTIYS